MSKLNYKESAQFFTQLAALLRTNIPLSRSLQLAAKIKNKSFNEYINDISRKVEGGETLASALIINNLYFHRWTVSLIEIAEYSGALTYLCEKLGEEAIADELQNKLYKKIRLDIIITIWSILTVIAVIFNPNTTGIFNIEFWIRSFGIGLFLWIVSIFLSKYQTMTIQKVISQIPIVKNIYKIYSLILFTKLYLPFSCGVSLLTSVELLKKHTNNYYLNPILKIIIAQVKQGNPLTSIVEKKFPKVMVSMLKVGEETGRLDESFIKIKDYYQDLLTQKVQKIAINLKVIRLITFGILVLAIGMKSIGFFMQSLPN